MGLAGIAALASGAAYHDAPGTGTQATPPTTQSTTQTVQNTVQSTTQTSPSVSTAQTNTTHTGDVVTTRANAPETTATGTNTTSANDNEERAVATNAAEEIRTSDKNNTPNLSNEGSIKIEEIERKTSDKDIKIIRDDNSSPGGLGNGKDVPCGANANQVSVTNTDFESSTLDRRRNQDVELTDDDPPPTAKTDSVKFAPRASPEADE